MSDSTGTGDSSAGHVGDSEPTENLRSEAGLAPQDNSPHSSNQSECENANDNIVPRRSPRIAQLHKSNHVIELLTSLTTKIMNYQQNLDEKFSCLDVVNIDALHENIADLDSYFDDVREIYGHLCNFTENKVDDECASMYHDFSNEVQVAKERVYRRIQEVKEQESEELEIKEAEAALEAMQKQLEEQKRIYLERKRQRQNLRPLTEVSASHHNIVHIEQHVRPPTPEIVSPHHSISSRHQLQRSPTPENSPSWNSASYRTQTVVKEQSSSVAESARTNQDESISAIEQLARGLMATVKGAGRARLEPAVFQGNHLEFADWEIDFDSYVQSEGLSGKEKLRYLKKYVNGPAKECIAGYFILNTEEAYFHARKQLKERYGRKSSVARAMREKLDRWPKIGPHDGQQLQKFSDFLSQVKSAMATVPELRILNDSQEIEKIAERLPRWLKTRWVNIVHQQRRDDDRYPRFAEFFELIKEQADILCEPLLSQEKLSKEEQKGTGRKLHTLSTFTAKEPRWCVHCKKEGHTTDLCFKLIAKPYIDTMSFLNEHKLCYCCIGTGHRSSKCPQKLRCRKCKGEHPTCLHRTAEDWEAIKREAQVQESARTKAEPKQRPEEHQKEVVSNTASKLDGNLMLLNMVVPVYVSAKDSQEILVYAVLDNGSDSTYINAEVAAKLQAPYTTERITVSTLTGKRTSFVNKYEVAIRPYKTCNNQQKENIVHAYEQDTIPCNRNQIPNSEMAKRMHHVKEIAEKLPPKLDVPTGILIGRDAAYLMAPHEAIIGEKEQPYAIRTLLGWTLCGGIPQTQHPGKATLCTQADAFTDLDDSKKMSQEDLQFLRILQEGITKSEDGAITLPLPFREKPILPNNRIQAEQRLHQLIQRFKKDEQFKAEYFKFVEEMISNGHAEPVEEIAGKPGNVWYLPHFAVHHPKKNTLRVVFDASVKFRDRCLNEELLSGPTHINSLIGILLRFRTKPIAISCDIQKMFLNFKVAEGDRDYLRFLWTDPTLQQIKEYRMAVHLFGATSSPGVATFALREIAKNSGNSQTRDFITHNFYVDDGIASISTVEEAAELVKDATEVCSKAKLRLHKFVSNNREVLQTIPTSEVASDIQGLNLFKDELPSERTLGLEWCIETDNFTFTSNLKHKPSTKRGILSVISQLFDPLGLLAPYLLQGRNIMQRACQEGCEWDEEVSPALRQEWEKWKRELADLSEVSIPRCIRPKNFKEKRVEVHHFSDACMSGFGACSYLRVIGAGGQVDVRLIMAKARVAPLKTLTIPRLELQAAVEAVRLSKLLKEELDLTVDEEFFWADSTAALGFIKNSSVKFHMFVANRVAEIRRTTNPSQWHHVAGKANPADLASRGCTLTALNKSNWWTGPQFLYQPDISEYLEDPDLTKDIEDSPEVKTALTTQNTDDHEMDDVISKFSSWKRLVRAVANAKAMLQRKSFQRVNLTGKDYKDAEETIIKAEQNRLFSTEIADLQAQDGVNRKSKIKKLSPFLDETGMLRMNSRVQSALTFKERNPLILGKSHLSRLIVLHYHHKIHHQGLHSTVTTVRQAGYCLVGARTVAKSVIHICVKCKILREKPQEQQMGLLPTERTEQAPPFSHVGIDTFGHFIVKDQRREAKRWGLILTCLYTRAVHIELLNDLTTDCFLQALRRFQAVRGPVATIYSDGGTNFIGGRNQLEKDLMSMKEGEVKDYLAESKIEFKVNTPTASHQGGVWERQIRTVRAILNGMAARYSERMTTEGLRTAFYEVMATINSRPLAMETITKTDTIITPNHLLTMKPNFLPPPPGHFDNTEVYGRNMYRKTQQLAEEFWCKWKSAYLPKIEGRARWERVRDNIKVGDIVVVPEESEIRNEWKMGRITGTHKGADGLVRKVSILIGTSQLDNKGRAVSSTRTTLERPIQKIILLHAI